MGYDYMVLYDSRTGNTQKLATEIFAALPGQNKDLSPIREYQPTHTASVMFLGFWTNRGSCSMEMMDFLSRLHGQHVAFFGTCGMGDSPIYYQDIARKAMVWLPDDNSFLGSFMCRGKMPIRIRRLLEESYELSDNKERMARLLHYYDEALIHPNEEDFEKARAFVEGVLEKMKVTPVFPAAVGAEA